MYKKVIFSIPLKAKKNSINWNSAIESLKRTVNSIKQQSVQEYIIYVATNDSDEIEAVFGSEVYTINADFSLPTHEWNRPSADKHKKRILIGSKIKKSFLDDCYIMFLDADDLIHKDLVKYILENTNRGVSHVIESGYTMDVGTGSIREVHPFAKFCGSCFIGYYRNEELPSEITVSTKNDVVCMDNIFMDKFVNCRTESLRAESINNYSIVPFPAVIYTTGSIEAISHNPLRNLRKTLYFKPRSIRSYLNIIKLLVSILAVRLGVSSSVPRPISGRLLKEIEIDSVKRDFGLFVK